VNVCSNVPDDFCPELKVEPSSDVTVWVWPLESQPHVTVPPAATEKFTGLNRSFCTSMSLDGGGGLLDVPPELLPHPDASSTDAAQSVGISH
jgi:hypothetical protein